MNSNGVSATLSAIVLQVTLKWNRAPGFSTWPTALASCRSASKREAQPAEFLCSRTRHGGRTSFQPLSRSLLTYWGSRRGRCTSGNGRRRRTGQNRGLAAGERIRTFDPNLGEDVLEVPCPLVALLGSSAGSCFRLLQAPNRTSRGVAPSDAHARSLQDINQRAARMAQEAGASAAFVVVFAGNSTVT
jgi:hypothetical protein